MTLPTWNPTPPVLEEEVQKRIMDLLVAVGFQVYRIDQENAGRVKRSRGKQTKGPSDIYAQHVGRQIRVWIEVKGIKTGHNATKAQEKFRDNEVAAGGHCIIGHNNTESLGGYTEVCDALIEWGLIG